MSDIVVASGGVVVGGQAGLGAVLASGGAVVGGQGVLTSAG